MRLGQGHVRGAVRALEKNVITGQTGDRMAGGARARSPTGPGPREQGPKRGSAAEHSGQELPSLRPGKGDSSRPPIGRPGPPLRRSSHFLPVARVSHVADTVRA